jgi:hypothetical protein
MCRWAKRVIVVWLTSRSVMERNVLSAAHARAYNTFHECCCCCCCRCRCCSSPILLVRRSENIAVVAFNAKVAVFGAHAGWQHIDAHAVA